MFKKFLFFAISLVFLGCTNVEDRHVFVFTIEGTAQSVDEMRVKMGPGIDFVAGESVELPVEIEHELFGNDLEYFFEIEHSNQNADVKLNVFIDGELIEEKSEFDISGAIPKITISGIYSK